MVKPFTDRPLIGAQFFILATLVGFVVIVGGAILATILIIANLIRMVL